MTKEQLQQQKIMKFMMVVLFPIMLYAAPSGLTLYIITSSLIGIVESRYIRRHVTEMDLKPKKPKATPKPKDAQGRAYAAAVERLEEARRRRALGPEKKFKKRKT
jgi:membrane protein insertase Oxa1/YidC/SpoIIIJ